MTARDMQRLRSALSELTGTELVCLDVSTAQWFPRLRGLPPQNVHGAICDAVQAVRPEAHRLRCISWLYCWIMPRRRVQPWKLYRMRDAPSMHECLSLLQNIACALRLSVYKTTFTWNAVEGAVRCCLLARSTPSPPVERNVVYVVLWPCVALMAVHASEILIHNTVLTTVRAVLPNHPVELQDVPRDDLTAAFRAGVRILDDLSNAERTEGRCAGGTERTPCTAAGRL